MIKGTQLQNRFVIEGLLGEGGMARVYLAKDLELNRLVALKMLKGVVDEDEQRRLIKEANNCSLLEHPNIVSIYSAFQIDHVPYIVMEYVEGKTLRQLLDEGMDRKSGFLILLHVALALDHAHKKGVVHRDIKPDNVLVTKEKQGKVTDWGLSRTVDDKTGLTKTGVIVGTPAYLAPERLVSREVNSSSDVYALGCMLFEVINGSPPFGSGPIAHVLQAHLKEKPPKVETNSFSLHRLVHSLLEKDPLKRPKQASDVATALEAEAAKAEGPIPPIEVIDPSLSVRRYVGMLSTVILSLLLGYFVLGNETQKPRSVIRETASTESFKEAFNQLLESKRASVRGSRVLLLSRNLSSQEVINVLFPILMDLHPRLATLKTGVEAKEYAHRLATIIDFISYFPFEGQDLGMIVYRTLLMTEGLRQIDNRLLRNTFQESAGLAAKSMAEGLRSTMLKVSRGAHEDSSTKALLSRMYDCFKNSKGKWKEDFCFRYICCVLELRLNRFDKALEHMEALKKAKNKTALPNIQFSLFSDRLSADLMREERRAGDLYELARRHLDEPPAKNWPVEDCPLEWMLWRDILVRYIMVGLRTPTERERALNVCREIFRDYEDKKYFLALHQRVSDLLSTHLFDKERIEFRNSFKMYRLSERKTSSP